MAMRTLLKELKQDWMIVPIIRAELLNPRFKGFTIKVEGWTPRPYDGKFHPSTHATWTPRQLALYVNRGEEMQGEQFSLASVLAITQGKFWHLFVQKLLLRHGILVLAEVPLCDEELNIIGHMDGLTVEHAGFELKTMNDWSQKKIETWRDYRDLFPDYYGQTQDYLMITNLSLMRVVIMSMTSPYHMVEVAVPADEEYQLQQRQKYREALALAAEGSLGEQCCPILSSQSKKCPMRLACPIGARE